MSRPFDPRHHGEGAGRPASAPSALALSAIAAYRESSRVLAHVRGLTEDRDDLERWRELSCSLSLAAERNLLLAILAFDDETKASEVHLAYKRSLPPRAVDLDGTIYLAVPACDPGEEDGKTDAMTLIVMPASAVVDLSEERGAASNFTDRNPGPGEGHEERHARLGPHVPAPRVPIRPREGARCFLVMTADVERSRMSHVGLTLEDVLDEEVEDYRDGLEATADRDGYVRSQEDRVIWGEGGRALALIRAVPGGDRPEVIRLDGPSLGPGEAGPGGPPAAG